jgi:hypothetical protein
MQVQVERTYLIVGPSDSRPCRPRQKSAIYLLIVSLNQNRKSFAHLPSKPKGTQFQLF